MPILDKNDIVNNKRYETFIQTSPYGHFMQSINWAKVKNNWNSDYVYLEEQGNIIAAMSIISISNDGKQSFLYVPRGPVCDLSNISLVKRLLKEAQPIIEKRNAFLLRFDPEVHYSDALLQYYEQASIQHLKIYSKGYSKSYFSNPRVHMFADLLFDSYGEYFMSLRPRSRNKIRKTYRDGLVTERINKNDDNFEQALDTFYELTQIMAKRQGISYRPKNYFKRLFEAFDDVLLYQTRMNEEVLSSCIVLTYNKKTFYAYAASSNEKRTLSPSMQMNNEVIKDAFAKGSVHYDMGGIFSTDNSDGLYAFKKQFCGEQGIFEMIGQFDIVYNDMAYNDFIQ